MLKNVVLALASAGLLAMWNASAIANPPAAPTEHAEDHGSKDHHADQGHHADKDHHADKTGGHHDSQHGDHHDDAEATHPKG